MTRKGLCFYDLPGELRNSIYELYAADADKTTVCFARGVYIPPPLALATRRVRTEFLDHWNSQEHLCEETRHIKLAVFDLDWPSATVFWEKAVAHTWEHNREFESACITLVQTKSWDSAKAKIALTTLYEWFLKNGAAVCPNEHEVWRILDYRRFGRLKSAVFCLSVANNPIKWDWDAILSRDMLWITTFMLKKWWHGSVRGTRSGRWMK